MTFLFIYKWAVVGAPRHVEGKISHVIDFRDVHSLSRRRASTVSSGRPILNVDWSDCATAQQPFGFTHNLMNLDIFRFENLLTLAEKFGAAPNDYFVASGAPAAGAAFYSVARLPDSPRAAMERLSAEPVRILLKRPERHDARFAQLRDRIFAQVFQGADISRASGFTRLETAVFITSAATITPFHFDPEVGIFAQIEGQKNYHIYPPDCVTDQELERFFVRGVFDIGKLALDGRDPSREHVFALTPGMGLYQPHNAPHWVETCGSRSISFSFVFQTRDAARVARVRGFNHYARKLGVTPGAVGSNAGRDGAKAAVMQMVTPARKTASRALSFLRRR